MQYSVSEKGIDESSQKAYILILDVFIRYFTLGSELFHSLVIRNETV